MQVTRAATATHLHNNPPTREAVFAVPSEEIPEVSPNDDLVFLKFDDDTHWAIYPESLGFPRTYAHDLLDEFVDSGGTVEV